MQGMRHRVPLTGPQPDLLLQEVRVAEQPQARAQKGTGGATRDQMPGLRQCHTARKPEEILLLPRMRQKAEAGTYEK